jgi:hypothetical protein
MIQPVRSPNSAFTIRPDGSIAIFQDAADTFDYTLDHAILLGAVDRIFTSTWSATGDVTISRPGVSDQRVSVWISGTNGTVSNVTTTQAGRSVRTCIQVLPRNGCAAS